MGLESQNDINLQKRALLIPRNKKLGVFASAKTSAKYMKTDES